MEEDYGEFLADKAGRELENEEIKQDEDFSGASDEIGYVNDR